MSENVNRSQPDEFIIITNHPRERVARDQRAAERAYRYFSEKFIVASDRSSDLVPTQEPGFTALRGDVLHNTVGTTGPASSQQRDEIKSVKLLLANRQKLLL